MRNAFAGLMLLVITAPAGAADFALRDGDTVVFLGDSITAARTYGKIIENYSLLRFPDRKVRFVNAGVGGDTAAGGLARLDRDVFPLGATVLVVAYGINDIGWGTKADDEHKRKYLDSIRGIVEACRKRKVRVFVCSAAVTAEDPSRSEEGFLQKMCDEGMEIARSLGEQAIDVQRAMRVIQKKVRTANENVKEEVKKESLHAADGVHLNDLGQLAMAYAILKGLGAPADVSYVRIDATQPKLVEAAGCKVTDLARRDGQLSFTRLDEGLPFNYGLFYALNFRFVPIPDELNRYLLTVENLPEGSYELRADGRGVGTFTARQLGAGVNIASTTADGWQPGGPWNAQADVLQALTDARHQVAVAGGLSKAYLGASKLPEELAPRAAKADEELVAMQRATARPRPYRFVLRKVEAKPPPDSARATLSGDTPEGNKRYFTITVVDEQTRRGVPLVELRTVHGVRYYTDSNGVVAFDEPGLMGKDVFFHVSSHGYEYPKDGFGYRGKALSVTPGGSAKLAIRRVNLAERLYRVTGGGIYRDSVLVGAKVPLKEPVLNGLVLGSDSVLNAAYRGKVYWFWGDTTRAAYPLGNYHVSGATSALPARGGLDPEAGIDLAYFVDAKGFARETAHMPGKGPTWLTALVPLKDGDGRERLYASYVKVEEPLKVYARGLAVFDDDKEQFEPLAEVDMKARVFPSGHAFRHTEDETEYVYFAHPFPLTRVRATAEHFRRVEGYETYTCLKEGSRLDDPKPDRDAQGRPRYAWRKNTPAMGPAEEAKLVAAGRLKAEERRWLLRDRDTGKAVVPHAGSVYWNDYRKRWGMIAVQTGGTSFLGEVWYAEADTPVGPWAYAVKVVTHDRYSFYNPKQHPLFDKDGGRVIFFEGTYSASFSGNPDPTPRYDYNQVFYKLDLADPRLALPVALYDLSPGAIPEAFGTRSRVGETHPEPRVAFFAPDRPLRGTVPVLADKDGLRVGKPGESGALFHAFPEDANEPSPATTPLYEYRGKEGGRRAYSVAPALFLPGYERGERPLCLVWRRPG